jgi:hypothetical protein
MSYFAAARPKYGSGSSKAVLLMLGVLACVAALGVFVWRVGADNGTAAPSKAAPDLGLLRAGFDCSDISRRGIDRQENLRAGAIMIACGVARGGSGSSGDPDSERGGDAYGGSDVDVITGAETNPNTTQSETFTTVNPDNPNQIVVAYNDSRGRNEEPINISGASVSTDGGVTFTRLTAADGQGPFPGTYGDPVVLYNKPTSTWLTVWIDATCGEQGLGGFRSTTPWDPSPASWTHYCIHSSSADDRESGWADNNPTSPFYGNVYVSYNNFEADGAIFVQRSTDNGLTWGIPAALTPDFLRNVQITGDATTGFLYLAAVNENGGGDVFDRNNLIYRSTDGGSTWANTYTGPTFVGAHRASAGYFATMYDKPVYWRHMGWGQPAAFNGVVSYVYSSADLGILDAGDVFYIRSTDSGVTFRAPVQLNTDTDHTKAQWQPNLSVSPTGTLLSTWYDETPRTGASCQPSTPQTPCYQIYSRRSNDNGLTWLPPDTLSDVVSPLPLQPDPGIVDVYAGDYDYGSAVTIKHVTSWTDGRTAVAGESQQDAVTDRDLVGFAVTSSDPTCNSIVSTQSTAFVVNLTDAVNSSTVQAGDLRVNGIPATSFVLSNGDRTITFSYAVSPVTTQGVETIAIAANAMTRTSDGMGLFAFACTFRYDVTTLAVIATNPAVGSEFNPPAPGNYQYDVNFNEPVDPASVSTSDLVVSGTSGPSVLAVTVLAGNMTARFTLHLSFGGSLNVSIADRAVADAFGNPNSPFAGRYAVAGCPPPKHYTFTASTGAAIVPGTTFLPGSACDDCSYPVTLPFPFVFYGQSFTALNAVSNGNLQLASGNAAFSNFCLPYSTASYVIMPYWDDLLFINGNEGIYTSTSGTAPNRIFNIEWRGSYYSGGGNINLEARLYETTGQIDFIYGVVAEGGSSATIGLQRATGSTFDQFECETGNITPGLKLSFLPDACDRTLFDYDGDTRSDVSVFRPAIGAWYLLATTSGFSGVSFGTPTDKIAPADLDGDGKTDVAVYRPSEGTWYWLNSSTGTLRAVRFGTAEDLPTPADYDGDGKADTSVFRPSNGVWYRLNSHDGSFAAVQFGASADKPTIGDYDGDGRADVAVYRPSRGEWYRLNSSTGQFVTVALGLATDVITPADFDGDGKTDVAVYRPSTGFWYSLDSSTTAGRVTQFGTPEDQPAAADFDGDGRADISVFRPSNGAWYRLNSGNGSFDAVQFGTNGDRATPAAFRY